MSYIYNYQLDNNKFSKSKERGANILTEPTSYLQAVIHCIHFFQHFHVGRKVSFEFFIKLSMSTKITYLREK